MRLRTEHEMIALITKIAETDERIRAAYLFGSRADPDIMKDKFQDYDIVYIVTETTPFISNKDWINEFGKITFVFEGLWNEFHFKTNTESIDFSRRYIWSMLLEDGNRIDLVMEVKAEALKNYYDKKYTVKLLDKDGCLPEAPPLMDDHAATKPFEERYTACCNGFWWFLSYVAKGIARDELPFAMSSYNEFIRLTLDQMIDWYIGTLTDFSVSTGKRGKYYKNYLPRELYALYAKSYPDSNYTNFWNAIYSSCDLFKIIALHVGNYFGYTYDKRIADSMLNYLKKVKDDAW